jgi:hypothetical protein
MSGKTHLLKSEPLSDARKDQMEAKKRQLFQPLIRKILDRDKAEKRLLISDFQPFDADLEENDG